MQSLIFRLTILLGYCLISATPVAALIINVDTVWPAGIYTIDNNLAIIGATLTIQEGATVKITADGYIKVTSGGVLDATGVTFTWAEESNEWKGIYFHYSDSRSQLVNCTIEHVKGYSDTEPAMIYYYGSADDTSTRIENCFIGNGPADHGIYASGGASLQILNNTVSGFSDSGVNLKSTYDTTVSGNTFQNNAAGVEISYSGGTNRNLTVSNNTYNDNTESDLRIIGGNAITIDAVWNEAPGTRYRVQSFAIQDPGRLFISDGIEVALNADGYIWVQSGGVLDATGVTFTWADEVNEWRGINFHYSDSRSQLVNCTIEHAKGYSDTVPAMIYYYGSGGYLGPQIEGCVIGNGTADRGIHASGGVSLQILNNTVSGFSDCGLCVVSSSSYFIVAGNIFSGNYRGIGISSGASAGLYRANIIQGNSQYGIYNSGGTGYKITEAEYNWWGDASGPEDLVDDGFYNLTGTGDPVSSYVDYVPWAGSDNDSEPDGMWDEWEIDNFTDTVTATDNTDFDEDGLLDAREFLRGTDPKNPDSDGDGVFDGLEVQCLLNPLLPGDFGFDSDGDSFSDLRELLSGTDEWNSADIPEIIADHDPQPSGDNDVDGKDLLALITEMGSTGCTICQFDLDGDGDVDRADLFLFAEDFGQIE